MSFKEKYQKEVVPAMMAKFGYKNAMAVPKIEKVVIFIFWNQIVHKFIKGIWKKFIPDLRQYAEAFKTDTWQPRQSGLCNGWCPVKECEFWKQKRK